MTGAVYHGSYVKIDEPNLSFCRAGRDFGRGFYVTKIRSQAEQWAVRKGKWRNSKGEVTEFCLHGELVCSLKLRTCMDGVFTRMDNQIVKSLMMDHGMDETKALDAYYTSQTYALFNGKEIKLHEKPWQEIYGLLKKELRLSPQPPAGSGTEGA